MKDRCREVLTEVYLYLDGEGLSAEKRQEIVGHLEECRPCLERYGLEEEVVKLLARLRGTCVCPDGLKHKIAELIHNA
ncbi:MAG TPA: mycothiol system anti-sigma-R factor [Actinomycetota bacterium]|nr:mycothiol system anti-sigma-R factor [Actinomycetota bacterium]